MSDLLTAALSHAARGWHVFPLRPDDKRPAFPDHPTDQCTGRDPRCRTGHVGWEARATTDPDRIRRAWSARPYGIGLACGPSRLVVVDLDTPKDDTDVPAGEWAGACDGWDVFATLARRHGTPIDPYDGFGPDTPPRTGVEHTYTVTTGRGGTHLYYQHPDDGPALRNTAGTLGPMVDTRAHGGYVVAAGSTVAGRPYRINLDTDPAPLPTWLAAQLAPAPLPPQRPVVVSLPTDRSGAYVRAAINREADRVTTAPAGERNRALYIAAVALGQLTAGGSLTETDASTALEQAAASAGLGSVETARTIRSGLAAGSKRPRRVAA
ncbi:Bifunctional DNA primase/polymerase, N-terminal [Micromonospora phaseoli]|uniref:Bifunctional DNA primase/polymerase, N-terminal n=1 Tax=Micromonospora phaseoli TaxID=1144548 RepID=A0A1H7E2L4_9ACTN|nr:bifunctional DNA primase/polymerase [Micromonospora phaseoli]PZV89945.1 bifunctional DNA primase/polymerase-like protein [Micromonospora phaseoli]GIJ81429.1 DNA primase [Micromonospora phaseoli]SEK05780.1 Bifunctional DNA primase/polymerase, N-terminal [Micromonospora phaseoli]